MMAFSFPLSVVALGALVFGECLNIIPVRWPSHRRDTGAPSSEAALLIFRGDHSSGHDTGIKLFSEPDFFKNVCVSKFNFDPRYRADQPWDGLFYMFNYRHLGNDCGFRRSVTRGWNVHSCSIYPIFDQWTRSIFGSPHILEGYIPNKIASWRLPAIRSDNFDDGNNGSKDDKFEGGGFDIYISPHLSRPDSLGAFSLATGNTLATFSLSFSGLPKPIRGFPQREREPSDNESGDRSEQTIMTVNRSDNAEHVTADEFSDYKALLIWLVVNIVGLPIVYAFGKFSGKILFNNNKRHYRASFKIRGAAEFLRA